MFTEIQAWSAVGRCSGALEPIERSSYPVQCIFSRVTRSPNSPLFSSSNVIPTKSLCIQSGKFVWVLYVDATCINYNGNVFDATLLAMVAALKNG